MPIDSHDADVVGGNERMWRDNQCLFPQLSFEWVFYVLFFFNMKRKWREGRGGALWRDYVEEDTAYCNGEHVVR